MKKFLGLMLCIATGSILLTSCGGGGMTDEEIAKAVEERYTKEAAQIESSMWDACRAGMDGAVATRVEEMIAAEEAQEGPMTESEKMAAEAAAEMEAKSEAAKEKAATAETEEGEEKELSDEEKIAAQVEAKLVQLRAKLDEECKAEVETQALAKFSEWKSEQTATASTGKPKPTTTKPTTATTPPTQPTGTTTTTGATKGGTTTTPTVTKGGQTGTGVTEDKPKVTKGGQ